MPDGTTRFSCKRLSWQSSVLPWFFVPDDGVEDGQKFAHGGDEGNDPGLAECDEANAKGLEHRVVTAGDEGCHEQHRVHLGPAPPMKLLPFHVLDCRVQGARPARDAICRRSRRPSSGISARSVRAVAGPTPGTDVSRGSRTRHSGDLRI